MIGSNMLYIHYQSKEYFRYFQNNPELKSKVTYGWPWAFFDYLYKGIKLGRKSILQLPPNSNFDWKYYVDHNLLPCNDEVSALYHYQTEGFFRHLPYCYPYTLVIMLHLYNLDLLDECINRLNYFMRINFENSYYIKINIPVASNITDFFNKKSNYEKLSGIYKSKNDYCAVSDEFNVINLENFQYVKLLVHYINQSLCIDSNRLEILFSPNRGRDVGGFFLSLDRLFKQNIAYDYIVKIHSKTSPKGPPLWRQLNMSFLNIHINPILRDYDCIYSNRIEFPVENTLARKTPDQLITGKNVMHLLNLYKLPSHDFNFCGGNMFIVSKKMAEFFRSYNLHDLFYSLNDEHSFADASDGKIEHAYERFFGYLTDHFGLKTFLLDYHPLPFPDDNSITRDYNVSIDYDVKDIRKIVHEHTIKMMALYSPIYYQKVDSSENQLDFWNSIKNDSQQVKRPHFDVGYYNILDPYVRKKQELIAQSYGIEAFCYQHFWVNGHSLLADGLETIVEEGVPSMPFTLCWMNGTGVPYINEEVNFDAYAADKEEHYAYLSKFFKHPLYIHHNKCPVLYIQHEECEQNKQVHEKLTYFKERAKHDGFAGLYIVPQDSQSLLYGLRDMKGEPLLANRSYRLFEQSLQKIIIHRSSCTIEDFNYILLLSWNDWYMQSMFEPNDHDGYELLKILQRYFV